MNQNSTDLRQLKDEGNRLRVLRRVRGDRGVPDTGASGNHDGPGPRPERGITRLSMRLHVPSSEPIRRL
jgi:hypothetical protein